MTLPARQPDWPMRFERFLAACRERPFAWGEHDCCLLVLDWIELATGRRPADTRGRYRDAAGAAAVMGERWGSDDLIAVVSAELGPPLASPLLAGRGDVLAFRHGQRVWLGLCVGHHGVAVTAKGLGTLPLGRAILGWRV